MKRLIIFLKLKWQETVGKFPMVCSLLFFGTLFSYPILSHYNDIRNPVPTIALLLFSFFIGFLLMALYLFIRYPIMEDFIPWIKDNWEEAGRLSKK